MASTLGKYNPFRYRGYVYDEETGLYYLNSRYYDPKVGRFICADNGSVLLESNDDLSNKNLFAYCDNNPVVRLDESGDFWQLALANGGSIAPTLGVTVGIFAKAATTVLGTMSPVGWTVLGVVAVAVLVATGLKYAKKKQKSRNKAKGKEQQKDRNKAPIASRNTYNTRKKTREAAQKAGKWKTPIHHSDGNNPHYHPDVPHKYRSTPHMPTYHDHYFYPR